MLPQANRHSIDLVSAQTLELITQIPPQSAETRSAVFSPDGKTLALICGDRTVRLVSTASGEGLITFDGFGQSIYFAQFAPDGMTMITASNEGRGRPSEWRLWRTSANEPGIVDRGR
jgi:WD40 repeat protein